MLITVALHIGTQTCCTLSCIRDGNVMPVIHSFVPYFDHNIYNKTVVLGRKMELNTEEAKAAFQKAMFVMHKGRFST